VDSRVSSRKILMRKRQEDLLHPMSLKERINSLELVPFRSGSGSLERTEAFLVSERNLSKKTLFFPQEGVLPLGRDESSLPHSLGHKRETHTC